MQYHHASRSGHEPVDSARLNQVSDEQNPPANERKSRQEPDELFLSLLQCSRVSASLSWPHPLRQRPHAIASCQFSTLCGCRAAGILGRQHVARAPILIRGIQLFSKRRRDLSLPTKTNKSRLEGARQKQTCLDRNSHAAARERAGHLAARVPPWTKQSP